jgi:hypothetical protein
MALLIRADGSMEFISDVHKLNADEIGKLVGGELEIEQVAGGYALIVNRQGGLIGCPLNVGATSLAAQCGSRSRIKGTAILLDREDVEQFVLHSPLAKLFDALTPDALAAERPLVQVRRDEFERFLRRHGNSWTVCGNPGWDEMAPGNPMSVDELMGAIEMYGPDCEDVYVFSDLDTPYDIANKVDFGTIPTVDEQSLDYYIVRSGFGKDFLYFACSGEEAGNGQCLTLMQPVETEE